MALKASQLKVITGDTRFLERVVENLSRDRRS